MVGSGLRDLAVGSRTAAPGTGGRGRTSPNIYPAVGGSFTNYAAYSSCFSFSTQASLRFHWWSPWHVGHSTGIVMPVSESNLIFSVVSPVGMTVPDFGQRITILAITHVVASARIDKRAQQLLPQPASNFGYRYPEIQIHYSASRASGPPKLAFKNYFSF